MFSKNSTRNALTMSVVSLVMCFAMLLGTTFAWFTSTSVSAVNSIKSGSLKVDIVDEDGNSVSGKTLSFLNADKNVLWEPGCTYAVESIKVKNTGNVAIKYKVEVIGIDGDSKLMDVIDWTLNGGAIDSFTGTILPSSTSDSIYIVGKMQSTAGNMYQNLTADGIAVAVYATQAASENDSYSDDYDAAAGFAEVAGVAFEQDEEVTVNVDGKDITLDAVYKFVPGSEMKDEYKDYNADYVVTFNKDVAENTVVLAGSYAAWKDGAWEAAYVPATAAGTPIRLVESLGYYVTYKEVMETVKEFNCGAASDVSGLTMTVELRLYERVSGVETGEYLTAGTTTYTF